MRDKPSTSTKEDARAAAYQAVENLIAQATSIIEYRSKGRVLVIDENQALADLGKLPDGLTYESVSIKHGQAQESIQIEGALGRFLVSVGEQELSADVVLDLCPSPILSMPVKPPGYLTLAESESGEALKAALAGMVGTFSKPKYFNFNESICAHGRSGNKGCSRCIDACPASAITSQVNVVELDPFRCQGGGICATVCPSGAISYAYPTARDQLQHVRTLIMSYAQAAGDAPDIAFVTEDEEIQIRNALPDVLLVTVEEVASVGPEIWLSALAWGAKKILLVDLQGIPQMVSEALDLHIEMVQSILDACKFPVNTVLRINDVNDVMASAAMPRIVSAKHAVVADKRQALYLALDHLVDQATTVEPVVSLPVGSIFGEVTLRSEACTLCMSCVSACPGNALQDGGDVPQLGFIEANCLQCDVCTSTCPEDAISILPRILLNSTARNQRRVLKEESAFHCIGCGEAFATQSGIEKIISSLSGHSMFADARAIKRLKMCSDCRVKDMMEDPNVEL